MSRTVVAALAAVALAAAAPGQQPTGRPVADFTLESVPAGNAFTLSTAGNRYVALHFLLKTECPICLRHTQQYFREADSVAGVQHIFIKPDAEADILQWTGKIADDLGIVIHRDPDAQLASAFGIPDGYAFHGESVHYPAFVLISPEGREVFRYVGKANTDRLSFDRFRETMTRFTTDEASRRANATADRGVMLEGYDPVSYVAGEAPTQGTPEWSSTWRSLVYKFATEQDRKRFAENPDRYIPQFGGWDATAMAEGRMIASKPTLFLQQSGRLYLFANPEGIESWKSDPGLRTAAEAAWNTMVRPTSSSPAAPESAGP